MYAGLALWVSMEVWMAGAPTSEPPEPIVEQAAPEPAPWWAPLSAQVSLENYVGIGTFVGNRHADDPYYSSWLTLSPSWALSEDLAVSLNYSLTYEWTHWVTPCHAASGPRPAGAPAEDCSDTAQENGRRLDQSDLELSVRHRRLWPMGPFSFSAWGALALPTSRLSRATQNLFTLGAGGGARFEYGVLTLRLGAGLRKFLPLAEAQVLDAVEAAETGAGGPPIARCASFRNSACVSLSGFVATWRAEAELGATVLVPWVEGLSASASLSYWYSRRHGRSTDALRTTFTDVNGRPIVDGVNEDDATIGTVDVTYAIDDRWSVSLGIWSWQPARTADGKALRFPFYDFISPASNFTTWYLGGAFSI